MQRINWYVVCDKGSISNPSNCECEINKSYDVGEHLDYENKKYRKKLVDELVDDCTENIDEVKIAALDYITLLYFVNKLPLCPQCLSVTICSQ